MPHSTRTPFARRFGSPLEWCNVDKALLIAALPMCALASNIFITSLMISRGEASSALSPHAARVIIEWGLGVVAGYGLIIGLGTFIRRRIPHSILFMHVTLQYSAITGALTGYIIGPFSSVIWLAMIGVFVLGLILFERLPALLSVLSFMFVLGATTAASGMGLLPHRSFLDASVTHQGSPPTWWLLSTGFMIAAITGLILVLLCYVVSSWRDREAKIVALSNVDGLTGLVNRRHLMELLDAEFSRAYRYRRSLACMMIDLDGFKEVNDHFGHRIGDEFLVSVATVLMRSVRNTDTVARYGGDELLILLPETDQAGAFRLAERCRHHIGEIRASVRTVSISITASIGVAVYPHVSVHTVNDLLDRADGALYRAKRAGRNQTMYLG